MKKTPLYHVHKEMGAKMMEFSGWLMPVQYEGIRAEHLAVRSSVGVDRQGSRGGPGSAYDRRGLRDESPQRRSHGGQQS